MGSGFFPCLWGPGRLWDSEIVVIEVGRKVPEQLVVTMALGFTVTVAMTVTVTVVVSMASPLP